jgi:hypothetical protein
MQWLLLWDVKIQYRCRFSFHDTPDDPYYPHEFDLAGLALLTKPILIIYASAFKVDAVWC